MYARRELCQCTSRQSTPLIGYEVRDIVDAFREACSLVDKLSRIDAVGMTRVIEDPSRVGKSVLVLGMHVLTLADKE